MKTISILHIKLGADQKLAVSWYQPFTVGKNERSSKTKMYKQKSTVISTMALKYTENLKKNICVPDRFPS